VRIEVRVVERKPEAVRVRFEVHDTGSGVPAHTADRIFEPFTQGDASSSRRHGGTGLGLAISKKLAELLGGSVGYLPRSGGGSTFWFEAPFAVPAAPEATLEKRLMHRHALVVERSPYLRRLVCEQLSSLGAACSVADGPGQALSLVRELNTRGTPCDFVVLGERVRAELDDPFFAELGRGARSPRVLEIRPFGEESAVIDARVHAGLHKPLTTERLLAAVVGEAPACEAPAREASMRGPRRKLSKARVLVVEDNPANQRVITLQLESLGVAADRAENGVEALHALTVRPYPLVLMDCQMPVMDGFEATRRIRERERGTSRRTRIVAFTANALLDEKKRCEEAGMDAVLTKPLMLSELEACLVRFLGNDLESTHFSVPPPAMMRELAEIGGTSLVEEVLESFRVREVARLDGLRAAVHAREPAGAVQLAHALKGVAAMSGFERLANVLREVEEQVKAQAWAAADLAAERIGASYEQDVASVQRFLRRISP
jgi:CheY-like chemotaxis protein